MIDKKNKLGKLNPHLNSSVWYLIKNKHFALILFLILISLNEGFAQIPPPPDPGAIPIDGGIGFLIAAGIAYGAKKTHDIGKKKK